MTKRYDEIARQFGQTLANKRLSASAELTAQALGAAFYALAEVLVRDGDPRATRVMAQVARKGFDSMQEQLGEPTFKQIYGSK